MRVRGEEPDATTWPVPEMEESDRLVEADYRKCYSGKYPYGCLGMDKRPQSPCAGRVILEQRREA